jgi:hypothetical protein
MDFNRSCGRFSEGLSFIVEYVPMPHWTLGHGADWDIIEEINQGSDRIVMVVGLALIDDRLTDALQKKLRHMPKQLLDRWFGQRGTYMDFQKKTDIVFMLNIYGPVTHKDLSLLAQARNEAAHHSRTRLFQGAKIKGICRDLKTPEQTRFSAAALRLDKKDPKDRFLFTVAALTDVLKLLTLLDFEKGVPLP